MFVGKSIGLIVINSCNNPLEVVQKILDLHSKGLKLSNGTYLDLTDRVLGKRNYDLFGNITVILYPVL